MDLGVKCLGPGGPTATDESTLILGQGDLAPRIDRVMAVVEGAEEPRLELLSLIREAFSPQGPAVNLKSGDEESFLTQILAKYELSSHSEWDVTAAIAVCHGNSVISASVGGSRALVVRSGNGAVQPPQDENPDGSIKVWRSKLANEDSVVLLGASVRGVIEDHEVRQSVQGCDAVDASAWLATLGSSRARRLSAALVATRHPDEKFKPRLGQLDPPVLPARSFAPPARFVALGVVIVAVLAVVLVVIPFIGASSSTAAQYLPPSELRVDLLTPNHVVLSWTGRPGVSDYQVQVGSHLYDTRTNPSADFRGVFPHGATYAWRVHALYGARAQSGWVQGNWFTVPTSDSVSAPTALFPLGRILVGNTPKPVKFCWNGSSRATAFDLKIGGGSVAVRTSVAPSALDRGTGGSYCHTQVIPGGSRISWLVGARFAGQTELWSGWHHVFATVANPAVVTPTPLPTPTPVVSTQSSTIPTTSYNTSPPVSTTSSPTTSSATTTTSTSSIPSTPPAVKACSTAPYC